MLMVGDLRVRWLLVVIAFVAVWNFFEDVSVRERGDSTRRKRSCKEYPQVPKRVLYPIFEVFP